MQRCPYIHEMRERLLGQPENMPMGSMDRDRDELITNRQSESNPVGTVVKLNSDGYGSHTSPTHQRTPLVPRDLGEDFSLTNDDESIHNPRKPKNANRFEIGTNLFGRKRTSLFIITSLVYAMLLIVVCVAYVISDVSTHRLPILYYEGFFTYLYGVSILFLLYVFCFLLQESTCCNGSKPKPPKEKKPKKQKPKKPEPEQKDIKGGGGKDVSKIGKGGSYQDNSVEVESAITSKTMRKRKTTQNDQSHGSFFLRVGAIAFGLGTMIYVGLEFGTFFEIPFTSPCHQILRGVNPLLQMIFTFMQMYFIFMNSRLNIHRFKVLARFGLMHICATNICVWIRTLVLESLKEITIYHQGRTVSAENHTILDTIRQHARKYAGTVLGTHTGPDSEVETFSSSFHPNYNQPQSNGVLSKIIRSTADTILNKSYNPYDTRSSMTQSTPGSAESNQEHTTTNSPYSWHSSTVLRKIKKTITSTSTIAPETTSTLFTTTGASTSTIFTNEFDSAEIGTTVSPVSDTTTSRNSFFGDFIAHFTPYSATTTTTTITTEPSIIDKLFDYSYQSRSQLAHNETNFDEPLSHERFDYLTPAALTATTTTSSSSALTAVAFENSTSCGRVDIMGSIVKDSAPYLYPFIIEYSLIGAVVIYVMWKHIGRNPKYSEEDLEHRLEVMLSRRAVAMAQAHSGRVDCVGASKGLFFGLLLLVGSLICLILFFVLVRHPHFSILAIYLADVSHCALMGFAVLAIFVGFIRVQALKFKCEDQSNLNDILLRISAFGLFIYSVFSVIAGSLNAFESEPPLLVMVTGILAVVQVVLQLLFIADVSRRRVHLPEHDRSKPARQVVTFLLICNIAMFAIYTFEAQKAAANPIQLNFYGFIAWSLIQRVTLPLCIFHRFHSAVTLAEIWKSTYKARLE